jgi:hypothetical protein
MPRLGENSPYYPAVLCAVRALKPAEKPDEARQRQIDHWAGRLIVREALRQNPKRPKNLVAELDALVNRIRGLEQHLAKHDAKLAELVKHKHLGNDVLTTLRELPLAELMSEVAAARVKAISADQPTASGAPRKKTGRLPERTKPAVADRAWDAYKDVTGKNPNMSTNPLTNKKYGQFLDFLKAIFAALRLNGGAEGWAEKAIAAHQKPKD